MATLWVAEVRVHSVPETRKTFIVYDDSKESIAEGFSAHAGKYFNGPWHELVSARPLNTSSVELSEIVNYGKK